MEQDNVPLKGAGWYIVGFVIVSHDENLAESAVGLVFIIAPDTRIAQVGGMDDGGFGTNFGKVQTAIESVYSDDGVLVLIDVGSAMVTTEMVVGTYEGKKVEMVDCPLMEGAMVATTNSVGGASFKAIKRALTGVGTSRKF